VWDVATGRPVTPAPLHAGAALADAEFSPDGRRVVTAGNWDATARIWDAETGAPLTPPLRHSGLGVFTAQFSPDGRRVVTGAGGRVVTGVVDDGSGRKQRCEARIWDAVTGAPIGPPLWHAGGVSYAEFSPDGKRIAEASRDGTARVWDASSGRPVTPPLSNP